MINKDIHDAFNNSGMRKWIIAEKIGISDVTFSKKLRKELSKDYKEKILQAIKEAKNESNQED